MSLELETVKKIITLALEEECAHLASFLNEKVTPLPLVESQEEGRLVLNRLGTWGATNYCQFFSDKVVFYIKGVEIESTKKEFLEKSEDLLQKIKAQSSDLKGGE